MSLAQEKSLAEQMVKDCGSVREAIVDMIRQSGYDRFTACEEADRAIKEFKQSGKKSQTFYIGKFNFTLEKK